MTDIARLHEVLRYEPATGKLFWRVRGFAQFDNKHAGKEAFTADNGHGYRHGRVDGKGLKAHRVIFAMMKGYWPVGVDHRNGIRSDNRWRNLREATKKVNAQNQKRRITNKSGVTGVYRHGEKWRAQLGNSRDGRNYLGQFDTKRAAVAARRKAEREAGYHRNHGRNI